MYVVLHASPKMSPPPQNPHRKKANGNTALKNCIRFFFFFFSVFVLRQDGYNEQQARTICRALLSAVEHCHTHDVIHRDLRPSNIMLSSGKATVKLTGFGLACSLEHGTRNEPYGARHYVAPEILCSEPYGKVWWVQYR